MKNTILYILLAAALWMIPVNRQDVGKLRPVQALRITRQGEMLELRTDTEDWGRGRTPAEAFADLERTTPAVIYLDTAEFVLLQEGCEDDLEVLRDQLKAGVKLCRIQSPVSPEQAAEYLKTHRTLPRLKEWKKGEFLPILEQNQGKLKILKKDENNG